MTDGRDHKQDFPKRKLSRHCHHSLEKAAFVWKIFRGNWAIFFLFMNSCSVRGWCVYVVCYAKETFGWSSHDRYKADFYFRIDHNLLFLDPTKMISLLISWLVNCLSYIWDTWTTNAHRHSIFVSTGVLSSTIKSEVTIWTIAFCFLPEGFCGWAIIVTIEGSFFWVVVRYAAYFIFESTRGTDS